MKVSLDWLKDFVAVRLSPKDLADRLTMAGLEVEAMEGGGDGTVFTLGLTPNRPDCLSVVGLGREVSTILGIPFKIKQTSPPKGEGAIKNFVEVKVIDQKGCPRYMARAIRGIRIAPSPDWLQEKLNKVGLRPINNVVDCTNYVMWELGHPLHAFDAKFLKGRQIVVRREKNPVRFTTLDGMSRDCLPSDLFICDGAGPVALAGIMGGANSEVRDDTNEIVLEAAYFDPRCIHRTAKRLKLSSESSHRFERGVDPNGVANALHRVTELILKTTEGKATVDWIDVYPKKMKPLQMNLNFSEVERVLGLKIPAAEAKKILTCLGFQVASTAKALRVSIPTFRPDISRTIDLVEEISRLKGYDKIPATLPKIQMNLPQIPKEACAEEITIETLTGLGFSETCHLSFTSLKKAELFTAETQSVVHLENPLSEDHLCLKSRLMPGLLDAASFNLHRQCKDIKLFELKKIFLRVSDQIVEKRHLGLVAGGKEWSPQWQLKNKPVDFYSLRGLMTVLTTALHIGDLEFVREDLPPFLVSTMGSWIYYKDEKVGWLGLLNPPVLKIWEIEDPIYAMEMDWEVLVRAANEVAIRFQSLSKYPYIERDVALVVEGHLPAKKVKEAIWNSKTPWIEKVQLFDLFRGGNLPPNKKSLALSIRYASRERTLTNEEVNEAHANLITRLEKELPAQLRK